ncbi:MAG: glycoside hydrolase family protein [Pseudomonadota bacterium]|nr:glycoside hydrolase family protein [Pseudomonadota bacterium]
MERLKQQIMQHEGLEQTAYQCSAGKTSIGYGRNLDDKGISQQEAEYLLENDLIYFTDAIERVVNLQYCNEPRKSVLINMAFNMGLNDFLDFKKTIAFVEVGDFEMAAVEMLDSLWASQVGERAEMLSEQMLTGEWQ